MKHKLAPVPGAPLRAALRRIARSVARVGGLTLAAIGGASPAFGQVIVSIEAPDPEAAESPPDGGQFVIRRVGGDFLRPVGIPLSVSGSATEGTDYSPLPDHVTLSLGQPSATIALSVTGDDGIFEGDETVVVTLVEDDDDDVTVSNSTATITIADSAYAVSAGARTNAVEGAGAGEFVVDLGARNESGSNLTITYSVGGTAESGVDYQALSGSADIPVGASTATITVSTLDDQALENEESVEITLTQSSDSRVSIGDPSSASLVIADDDAAADDDGDGLQNGDECPDFAACRDTDQDGMPDYQDPDDENDGVPTASENPAAQDTDGDRTPDYLDPDDDGDGRPTRDEDADTDGDGNPATNPTDLDGDGVPDYLDADDGGGPAGDPDGDGLTNEREEELGTDPGDPDTDDDGVNDGDEDAAGTDPLDARSVEDTDGDLVPDAVEAADGSNPRDPDDFADGDGGGTADHVETVGYAAFGLPAGNPADAADDRRDTDGDGLPDRLELWVASAPDSGDSPTANGAGDDNANGVSNAVEAWLARLGIVAVDASSDFDRDGYPDAAEVTLGLDPLSPAASDADADGVPNVVEALAGIDADPATDSDGDGVPDAREIALGANPLDANSPVANGAANYI